MKAFAPIRRMAVVAMGLSLLFSALPKVSADEPASEKTPLESSMHRISSAFKELNADLKQPVDTSKDDYLKSAQVIRDESVKAHDLAPKMAATLPADQQPVFIAAYQKDMDKFTASVDLLIAAIRDGRWDDARTSLADLKQQEKDGHHAYRAKEKDKGAPPAPAPAQ